MLASISQKTLHGFHLQFRDHRSSDASVFPFFDDEGKVRCLMLTHDSDGEIYIVDHSPTLFAGRAFLPRMFPQRITASRADLRSSDSSDRDKVEGLWHFDPWWELANSRYDGHAMVPPIKETNLPGYDERITRIWFDATLSRVTYVGTGESDKLKVKVFDQEALHRARRERDRQTASVRRSSFSRHGARDRFAREWRLRPFWM